MATSTASSDGDGSGRLSFWSGGWGVFFPDFDRFSSSSSRSWFRRKSVLRFALIETEVRRKSRSWFFVSDRSVLRLAICNFVFMLWVLLGSRVFFLFRESLKGEYFSGFFGSIQNRDSIFLSSAESSRELGRVDRVPPIYTEFHRFKAYRRIRCRYRLG